VQDTRLRATRETAASGTVQAKLGPDSLVWLFLVAALFVLSELLPGLLRLPLGADEITYIARTSVRSSGVFLPPVHGHGAGLLAAPVTLLTSSLTALRVWMAVLSGVALFLSMLCWRGLRPAWVLALAAFIFASLAITQLSGVQVYPDLWAGFGALAITGLVLQAVEHRIRASVALPAIAFVAFVVVMMRPQNIVFVLAPTFAAPLLVRRWRQPGVLIAMIIGMAAGVVEWVAESYLWFGGLLHRIQLANGEPPKFGFYFSLPMQIRTTSGPWYCEPGTCLSLSYPYEIFWWLALFCLVALGLWAAWRLPSKASSVLAAATGAWVALLYILLVPFGAPRYFLPTWALFAILAADGIAWLVTVPDWKTIGAVLAGVFLIAGVVSQHVVLSGETAYAVSVRPFQAEAQVLKRLGVKPPCAISSPSVAYYVGCYGAWSGGSVREALALAPGGAKSWREIRLPGLSAARGCDGLSIKRPSGACWYWVPKRGVVLTARSQARGRPVSDSR
jgi:hypothetical protein